MTLSLIQWGQTTAMTTILCFLLELEHKYGMDCRYYLHLQNHPISITVENDDGSINRFYRIGSCYWYALISGP